MLLSLPMGMRIMEPRSVGDALIWLGASKCGSTAVGVHAGIEQKTDIVAVGEDAVHERVPQLAEFLLPFGVPEQVLATLADRDVGVHAAAVYAHHWLGQE